MKNIFIYFFISTSLIANGQTSVYHPFPDSAIVWREDGSAVSGGCCCNGGINSACLNDIHYEYFISGDTAIGTNLYKKLYSTGIVVQYISGPFTCPGWCGNNFQYSYFNDVYTGGLRQDISNKKVYFIPPGAMQDTLLYDFNLNVGDLLPPSYNNTPLTSNNYVESIDSVLIGNNYHKCFKISSHGNHNYVSIIEGIGSTYGLLWRLETPFEAFNDLTCVSINALTVFPDTLASCSFVSTVKKTQNDPALLFYPNPFHSEATLLIDESYENSQLLIYNVIGEYLRRQVIHGKSTTLNRDQLPNGIYFFQIRKQNGQIISGKFLVN